MRVIFRQNLNEFKEIQQGKLERVKYRLEVAAVRDP